MIVHLNINWIRKSPDKFNFHNINGNFNVWDTRTFRPIISFWKLLFEKYTIYAKWINILFSKWINILFSFYRPKNSGKESLRSKVDFKCSPKLNTQNKYWKVLSGNSMDMRTMKWYFKKSHIIIKIDCKTSKCPVNFANECIQTRT